MSELEAIRARARAYAEHGTPGLAAPDDRKVLLSLVEEQAAKLDQIAALAETWRYKGEFGWGAWQEGYGPDPEGYMLDTCAGEIRAVLGSSDSVAP